MDDCHDPVIMDVTLWEGAVAVPPHCLYTERRNVMTRWMLATYLLLCAGSLSAQERARVSVGIGPQLGIYKSTDADNARVMGGAAVRIRLSEAFGAEASINYREEDYDGGRVGVQSWPVMVTGLIYPIPVLYGAIGAGWYNSSIEYRFPPGFLGGPVVQEGTRQEFGWHVGGGAELPVGSTATLVGDIRYVFLDYDFQRFPGSDGVKNDFYVITVGFLFGL